MRRSEEGGYDAWGVVLPDGKIREFNTWEKAAMFMKRMEGQTILDRTGAAIVWTGLTMVHRFIPEWSPVNGVDQLITEHGPCPLCGATDPHSQEGAAQFCSHGFHAPTRGTRDA